MWGADAAHLPDPRSPRAGRDHADGDSPVARLKLVMDAWCALWMWAPEHGTELPTFAQWLHAIELLFGQRAAESGTLLSLSGTTDGELGSVEYFGRAPHAFVVEGEQAAFAGGGDDQILAETKRW